jgi:2-polyprenyl-3-methyl-5-hydroxy-6-metoxy-1,4-benzoquinol methylase
METNSPEYLSHLNHKYLPGRSLYLRYIFYPKIYNEFPSDGALLDLGCGMGEFLSFCSKRKRSITGIDSNQYLIDHCKTLGYEAYHDDICQLESLQQKQFSGVLCDNVLEHLTVNQINTFFKKIKEILLPGSLLVVILPDKKGFQKDPTHKTFLNPDLMLSLLRINCMNIKCIYFHPINTKWIGKYFYLNMQVFVISV